ncbi:inositol monophosphatase [Gallibacterium anatis]|uniref:Inositol-1-monophosphatase n=2 Tax=Gallibacterium anatis TaxID=750 RepID=F4HCL0_GALAU|nr:inositol monophosphatase [Gallibacterium anatis]AEC17698.1 inositol monophosphatase [Gallibacterium anatis UMN179]KGQ44223.1 inositol monophosphatase [Gallibacterium anatis]KGQ56389.1 inositol monophosphatase [Gallibacterium anatis str. Avicor]WIM83714.1 inositol monophosphatase [Gallibacterium anatis]HJF72991.1 inositol monophosphatase [Gallibacterium anatis]
MDKNIQNRYLFSLELIKKAGESALSFYLNREKLAIECKQGNKQDQVSNADKFVEQLIYQEIMKTFPEDGFFGEESGYSSLDCDFCWIVDPIDGTSPFLNGLHAWCISIALLHQGEIVVGLVFDPLHNELFHTQKHQGAYLNSSPIKTRQNAKTLEDGLVGMGMSHRIPAGTILPFVHQLLLNGGMYVRNGSGALSLAQVAAGRLLAFYEPHMNCWDSAAGILLVSEAGGSVNNILANDGLLKGNLVLAAANQTIYNQLDQMRL